MGHIEIETIFKCKNKIVESEKNTILQQKIHEIFQENDLIEYMLYNDALITYIDNFYIRNFREYKVIYYKNGLHRIYYTNVTRKNNIWTLDNNITINDIKYMYKFQPYADYFCF